MNSEDCYSTLYIYMYVGIILVNLGVQKMKTWSRAKNTFYDDRLSILISERLSKHYDVKENEQRFLFMWPIDQVLTQDDPESNLT